jgi:N6-adenosine-specific RNA methylase IME4
LTTTLDDKAHLHLWVPNALRFGGLDVMKCRGFTYKSTRGNPRIGAPGRRQVNFPATRKREHSRKPDEIYSIIEACSYGPYLEMFVRRSRGDWRSWGSEVDKTPVSRRDRGEQLLVNPMYA